MEQDDRENCGGRDGDDGQSEETADCRGSDNSDKEGWDKDDFLTRRLVKRKLEVDRDQESGRKRQRAAGLGQPSTHTLTSSCSNSRWVQSSLFPTFTMLLN